MQTLVLAMSLLQAQLHPQAAPPRAVIRRMPPSAFHALPDAVRTDLEARHCTIPQPSLAVLAPGEKGRLHNVIYGAFLAPAAHDVAVLCSDGVGSRIIVYWNGRPDRADQLEEHEDRTFMQDVDGRMVFSRLIETASVAHMRRHYLPDLQPPSLSHEGIEDSFLGKASTVWYFRHGKWERLNGMDD